LRGEELTSYKSKGGRHKRPLFEDSILKKELGRKIQEYKENGEYFTLDKLFQFARVELEYNYGHTTLYSILKSMGFRYKFENNKKILMERSFIIAIAIAYLQYLKNYPNVKFIYLDETWIYRYGSQQKTWVNDDLPSTNYKIYNPPFWLCIWIYGRVRSPVRYQK
jgi:hypothetical protein